MESSKSFSIYAIAPWQVSSSPTSAVAYGLKGVFNWLYKSANNPSFKNDIC
jgi:hypothetical protein